MSEQWFLGCVSEIWDGHIKKKRRVEEGRWAWDWEIGDKRMWRDGERQMDMSFDLHSLLIYIMSSFIQHHRPLQLFRFDSRIANIKHLTNKQAHLQRKCTTLTSFLKVFFHWFCILILHRMYSWLMTTTRAGQNRDESLMFVVLIWHTEYLFFNKKCLLTRGSTSIISLCWL